jgi:23S rRNA (uracil1939-C5)-methyltransferase
VGLFSIPLAKRFRTVTAVESGSAAVRDLQFNAERAGVTVLADQSDVEPFLMRMETAPDLVVLDPPRAGVGKGVVRELARLQPGRIVVVACDPATLARDLAGFRQAGYRIARMILLDLFPQTYHLETVVELRTAPGTGIHACVSS